MQYPNINFTHAAYASAQPFLARNTGQGARASASEIAYQLPTNNPKASAMLDRMLHLFATHSLLSCSSRTHEDGRVESVFGLTPACMYFLGRGEDGNVSGLMTLACHPATLEVWLHLKDLILEGGNMFKKIKGKSVFEYMNKDQKFRNNFNRAMCGASTLVMNEILKTYEGFEGISTLVDVGGGTGRTLQAIISKYPSIKGINYDLPHVIQTAPHYPGIQQVGGDMFKNVPEGDAIVLKATIHDWDDEIAIKILNNCYEALPKNGKLMIINELLPEKPDTSNVSQYAWKLDNLMLVQPGGKERNAKQYEALTKAAGFTHFTVACLSHGVWAIMESYK
ncbi:hypothetical protein K2173_005305 [Erythroxylum novogranatense]|uniref:Uncharacterized protein n=1 Tax=Erythroxylum novogranatense TaxID=1862640 RepID=A0AAV8TRT3_9ROSI|nr:hypothetical protein K2173_005305 [Erythroxylum novogranatense]